MSIPDQSALPLGARRVSLAPDVEEVICQEEAIFLDVGGTRLLSMRTPMGEQADLDWALGFLASEGVIQDISEVKSIAFRKSGDAPPPEIHVELWRPSNVDRLGALSRTHEMRASCGLCGVTSAEALLQGVRPLKEGQAPISMKRIGEMIETLRSNQPLFDATGGCHGVAILSLEGEIITLAEDIGRHNALDRAIGAAIRQGVYLDQCVAVLSGRAGYELVIKAVRVGIPTILSIGAASSFAIEVAQAAEATLVGFIRTRHGESPKRAHIYCGKDRIAYNP